MNKKKKGEINLLPQDKFAVSGTGRILNWLLRFSRNVSILIELILMGAFLSRFWLDTKISALNTEIKTKQAIISSHKQFEDNFVRIQNKLKVLALLTAPEGKFLSKLDKVTSLVPTDIVLSNLKVTPKEIQIGGSSSSENQIAQLLANLKSTKEFSSSALSSVQINPENQRLEFSLEIQTTE